LAFSSAAWYLGRRMSIISGRRQDFRGLPGRVGGALAVNVLVTQLQRVHASFSASSSISTSDEFTLGRSVGPEGRTPGVVGAHGAAFAPDVGDVVARAHELGPAQGQKVAELGIGTVVHGPVGFHGQQLAFLVGGKAHVDKEGRTLAGVGHLLMVVIDQKTGLPVARQAAPTRASMVGLNLYPKVPPAGFCTMTIFSGSTPRPGAIISMCK
jgi:hypothetical protein